MLELVVYTDRLGLAVRGQALVQDVKRFPFALKAAGLPQTNQLINVILNEDQPPERGIGPVPFEFASPRSAKWFFAHYPEGYDRTDTIKQWQATIPIAEIREDQFVVRLENPVPYTGYVREPRQVPGHRTTGWKPYRQVIIQHDLHGTAVFEVGQFFLTITRGFGKPRVQ